MFPKDAQSPAYHQLPSLLSAPPDQTVKCSRELKLWASQNCTLQLHTRSGEVRNQESSTTRPGLTSPPEHVHRRLSARCKHAIDRHLRRHRACKTQFSSTTSQKESLGLYMFLALSLHAHLVVFIDYVRTCVRTYALSTLPNYVCTHSIKMYIRTYVFNQNVRTY